MKSLLKCASITGNHKHHITPLLLEKRRKYFRSSGRDFSRTCDLYRVRPNCVKLKQRRHTTYNKAAQPISLPCSHKKEGKKNLRVGGSQKNSPPLWNSTVTARRDYYYDFYVWMYSLVGFYTLFFFLHHTNSFSSLLTEEISKY